MTALIGIVFFTFVAVLVLLELGIFQRKAQPLKIPEALAWSAVWFGLALAFNLLLYFHYDQDWLGWMTLQGHQLSGRQAAVQFFISFLLEKSIALDNMFVIAMIFSYFRIPLEAQQRVLFWGILGVVVLRGVMLLAGVGLVESFAWLPLVLGVVLIASAFKLLIIRHDSLDPEGNLIVRLARKAYPFGSELDGRRFFTRQQGIRHGTPLLLALILVVTSDLMFAVDAVPAALAITSDPALILTSNLFAILGLKSLYFALAGLMDRFRYFKMSLVFILVYIGIKVLLTPYSPIPNLASLAIIAGILAVGLLGSLIVGDRDPVALLSPLIDDLEDLAILTYRQARRIVILIVGTSLLLVGIVMIFLPAPAILVIPLGLTVLSLEFAWARLWLRKFREKAQQLQEGVDKQVRKWTHRGEK